MADNSRTVVEQETRWHRALNISESLVAALEGTEPFLHDEGLVAGPCFLNWDCVAEVIGRPPDFGLDNLHFPLNVETLLRLGFRGIADRARETLVGLRAEAMGAGVASDDLSRRICQLECIAQSWDGVACFAARHGEAAEQRLKDPLIDAGERRRMEAIARACGRIASGPPTTFLEAVQTFWFAWNIRGHGTVGRLDQHFFPFYREDLHAGRIDREGAFGILRDLWLGFNRSGSGDTLMNLMLGGQDREGRDATNEVSMLMLDVALDVRNTEPQLSARIHKGSPEAFIDRVIDLQMLGHGRAVYSDEAIIPQLVAQGVPIESARNYANDGCTEITIDGESGIDFVFMEAVKALELTLFNGEENLYGGEATACYVTRKAGEQRVATSLQTGFRTGDFREMETFEELLEAYARQYEYHLDRLMAGLEGHLDHCEREGISSPIVAGTFPRTLETGVEPYAGGFTQNAHTVFLGSLPTVADALAAIRRVVYEQKACTREELLDALRHDYEGYEDLRRQLLAAPKFGNDEDYVDELAASLARRFCERVRAFRARRAAEKAAVGEGDGQPKRGPIWPALFCFLFGHYAHIVRATPDGRRWKDPIAEHYSPVPGRARRGPTAVMRSAAKGPLAEACGSSPVHVSLGRSTLPPGDEGRTVVKSLVRAAGEMGIAVLSLAIYDVEALKAARVKPEEHEDLIVRVWGFSARFVELADHMQEHIIARAITNEG